MVKISPSPFYIILYPGLISIYLFFIARQVSLKSIFTINPFSSIMVVVILLMFFVALRIFKFLEFKTESLIVKNIIGNSKKIKYSEIERITRNYDNSNFFGRKSRQILLHLKNGKKISINPNIYGFKINILSEIEKYTKKTSEYQFTLWVF